MCDMCLLILGTKTNTYYQKVKSSSKNNYVRNNITPL